MIKSCSLVFDLNSYFMTYINCMHLYAASIELQKVNFMHYEGEL